jgi:hypothetical protein
LNYIESDSEIGIEEDGGLENIGKQNRKKWVHISTFQSKEDALTRVKSDSIWSIANTNMTSEGKRVYYRCNQVKRRGKQCPASIYLLYHCEDDTFSMFQTTDQHDHQNSSKFGIKDATKKETNELFKLKIKPKRMLELIEEKKLPVPSKQQLSNYLSTLKKSTFGNNAISLGELEAWCQAKSIIPDNDDEPWVVRYKMQYEDEDEIDDDGDVNTEEEGNKFRFCVSTKRLLRIATISNIIHADATYKLIWQGFPCLITGTSDIDRMFHPYGFAVCSNIKKKEFEFLFQSIRDGLNDMNLQMYEDDLVLVSDAIRNALREVFGFDTLSCNVVYVG